VDASKVTVIPPGIDLARWQFERSGDSGRNGPIRLLFVGGDFRRKGGDILLQAFRKELKGRCELDIVTREEVETSPGEGIRVHHGLTSNAPALLDLYANADMFVFPTLGDCLPIAVMEAMASGLPVVSTCVGAISEEVEDGRTGFLTPPGDAMKLAELVARLAGDRELRHAMGVAGRRAAEERFDGEKNYRQALAVCKRAADER
jgi:glycosyltransferase involved in cell wall biosynthesis